MRPPKPIRPRKVVTTIPEDLLGKLRLHLYKDSEGKIPHGAFQEFICTRIREYFDHKSLDLSEFLLEVTPKEHVVKGKPDTIAFLRVMLERHYADP